MGRRRHRFTSFLGSDATTPPPSTSGAECATNPSSTNEYSSSSSSEPLLSASFQSKSWNAARPLVNRFMCPSPAPGAGAGAGAGAAACTAVLPLPLGLLEDERDLLRRKKDILFTSELFGLAPDAPVGGLGGSGQAPPSFPQHAAAAFLAVFCDLDLLLLIWPMQDTLGDDGSGVLYPLFFLLLPLLPPPRASGGTMETIGPEKALRWLNDDLPPPVPVRGAAKFVEEEEKDAAVDLRKDAKTPAAPPALLVLACFGFLSIALLDWQTIDFLLDQLDCWT